MKWPEQKKFAFTVVDDTDKATVQNVGPVYDLLAELGINTTKTVWPIAPSRQGRFGGNSVISRRRQQRTGEGSNAEDKDIIRSKGIAIWV